LPKTGEANVVGGTWKGWRVRQDKKSKRWRGEYWVKDLQRYKSKTFVAEKNARAWAKEQAAQITLGKELPDQVVQLKHRSTAQMAEEYVDELKSLGRAESTVKDVKRILGNFAQAVPVLDAPRAEVQAKAWVNNLTIDGTGRGVKGQPVSPARRNKFLVNARALCRWAVKLGYVSDDPTQHIRTAQVDSALKPQFSLDEIEQLLTNKRPGSLTHRWVLLMLLAGLRSDEARKVRWCDISDNTLLVSLQSGAKVKRRKERLVPVMPVLAEALDAMRPTSAADKSKPIAGLGPDNLRRAWRDYLAYRDIDPAGRTPHSCRHTYAGLMTATGVPSLLLAAYLGHSSAQTTMGYVQMAARYAQIPRVKTWPRGEFEVTVSQKSPGGNPNPHKRQKANPES
jgi:integrase